MGYKVDNQQGRRRARCLHHDDRYGSCKARQCSSVETAPLPLTWREQAERDKSKRVDTDDHDGKASSLPYVRRQRGQVDFPGRRNNISMMPR